MDGWQKFDDPGMHARISAAVAHVFANMDQRAVRTDTAGDGSDLRYALFAGADGKAPAGWDLFEGVNATKASPFRRADYFHRSDRTRTAMAAHDDGHTVLFIDDFGVGLDEAVAGLEKFAAQVGSQP